MFRFSFIRKFAAAVQNNLSRGKCDLADLIAINIERSRERGVGGYTRYRNGFCKMGRKKVKEFDDLKKDGFTTEAIKNLKMVYKHVDDIDLFTGCKCISIFTVLISVGVFSTAPL